MFGWIFGRKHWKHEDRRYLLWRDRWSNGLGLFGIKSIPINFFFFYHFQSLSNALFLCVPLMLASENPSQEIHMIEWFAIGLWLFGFTFENIADYQLTKFKTNPKNKGKVMSEGLWKYSRHPNYFGEFLIWLSYTLYATVSVMESIQWIILGMIPILAYYFLVYFTGAWITEKGSMLRRGEDYKKYIGATQIFFPWFPKTKE